MLKTEFFTPLSDPAFDLMFSNIPDAMAASVSVHSLKNGFPDTENAKIAIIGIPEYRGSVFSRNFRSGTEAIREKLYRLKVHEKPSHIVDLGDLIPGNTLEDTYFALTEILAELLNRAIIPVVIGGSNDLAFPFYNAYKGFNKLINIAGIDSRFDLGLPEESFNSATWLGKIILQQPNYLFNFSNIGYQTYFVGATSVDLMNKLYFDAYRVGQVRSDITEIEPVIRTADLLTVDLSAIRQGDAPGTTNPSPNGFTGEELCQVMMYAGLNDHLTGVGIFEFDSAADRQDQTAHLVAQMIWYFIEGVTNRKHDFPSANHSGFITYRVTIESMGKDLVFLKHQTSGRWWMEMPESTPKNRMNRYNFLPCSAKDYQQACDNEMPDRYWQALQKL
ncbi:MAG: formimidoylglutamase [Bacteroidota bacterium]|nr:formimidoylglutamase [Bacteroidota bacterium]